MIADDDMWENRGGKGEKTMPRIKGSPHVTNKNWRDGRDKVFGKNEEKTEAEKRIEKVLTMDVVRKGK